MPSGQGVEGDGFVLCQLSENVTRFSRIPFLLSTTNWHLPSTLISIKSCATAAALDFQHPLKGV